MQYLTCSVERPAIERAFFASGGARYMAGTRPSSGTPKDKRLAGNGGKKPGPKPKGGR